MSKNYSRKYNKYFKKYNNYLNKIYKLRGGVWNCSFCTFQNADLMPHCEMCSKSKINTEQSSSASGTSSSQGGPAFNFNQEPDVDSLVSQTRELNISKDIQITERINRDKDRNTFYIFTTGMSDGEINEYWFSTEYLLHIISLIPPFFNNTKVLHFDPNLFEGKNDYLLKTLINSEITKDSRITESDFFNIVFPFQKIQFQYKNHLLIDMAHIFKYEPHQYGIVKTSNHYRNFQEYTDNIIVPYINSVYFGYLGDDYAIRISRTIFFRFLENNKIITFIERLLQKNFNFNPLHPTESINKLVTNIISKDFFDIFKVRYNGGENYSFYDDNFLYNVELVHEFIEFFMNEYVWSDMDIETFKRLCVDKLKEKVRILGKPVE